jgi:hypothetical protein
MPKTMKNYKSPIPNFLKNQKNVYSEDDYNSNDGMLTTVWGPSMWHYLHTMSFNYPNHPTEENKKHYRDFILNLENVLPCGKCRKNLKKNFKKLPLEMKDMESRDSFSRYIYNLHEVINKMLKKKSGLTYEDVRERYEHFRARCAKPLKSLKKCSKPKNSTIKHVRFSKKIKTISEKGCTEPLYGEKSKCVLKIVPQDKKCESFEMDEKCIKKRESDIVY